MPNYLKLPTSTKGLIRVVIETPRGAAAKLAYDPGIQVFGYVRPLPVGMIYPYDWGFVPSTLGEDGDPLDGLVIHQAATAPGVVIKCDLLGALRVKQRDRGGQALRNDRYVFCPRKEDAPDEPVAADQVPDDLRREIEQFFLSRPLSSECQRSSQGNQKGYEGLCGPKLSGWAVIHDIGGSLTCARPQG